jgi:hypothetical protein
LDDLIAILGDLYSNTFIFSLKSLSVKIDSSDGHLKSFLLEKALGVSPSILFTLDKINTIEIVMEKFLLNFSSSCLQKNQPVMASQPPPIFTFSFLELRLMNHTLMIKKPLIYFKDFSPLDINFELESITAEIDHSVESLENTILDKKDYQTNMESFYAISTLIDRKEKILFFRDQKDNLGNSDSKKRRCILCTLQLEKSVSKFYCEVSPLFFMVSAEMSKRVYHLVSLFRVSIKHYADQFLALLTSSSLLEDTKEEFLTFARALLHEITNQTSDKKPLFLTKFEIFEVVLIKPEISLAKENRKTEILYLTSSKVQLHSRKGNLQVRILEPKIVPDKSIRRKFPNILKAKDATSSNLILLDIAGSKVKIEMESFSFYFLNVVIEDLLNFQSIFLKKSSAETQSNDLTNIKKGEIKDLKIEMEMKDIELIIPETSQSNTIMTVRFGAIGGSLSIFLSCFETIIKW